MCEGARQSDSPARQPTHCSRAELRDQRPRECVRRLAHRHDIPGLQCRVRGRQHLRNHQREVSRLHQRDRLRQQRRLVQRGQRLLPRRRRRFVSPAAPVQSGCQPLLRTTWPSRQPRQLQRRQTELVHDLQHCRRVRVGESVVNEEFRAREQVAATTHSRRAHQESTLLVRSCGRAALASWRHQPRFG